MSLETAAIGLCVGFLVGLTGVGGAALLTPALLWMGIHPIMAVGTDLLYSSVTKLFGTVQHLRQRTVDRLLVRHLLYGSVPAAVLAFVLLRWYGVYDPDMRIVKSALGVVLVVVSGATLLSLVMRRRISGGLLRGRSAVQRRAAAAAIGAVLGFIVGFTSVGSGSLFALAMMLVFGLSGSALVGTDIAHAFVLVTVSAALHAGGGTVDYGLTLNLLAGSIPGVLLGSRLSLKLPAAPMRIVISILILLSGLRLLGISVYPFG